MSAEWSPEFNLYDMQSVHDYDHESQVRWLNYASEINDCMENSETTQQQTTPEELFGENEGFVDLQIDEPYHN